MNEKQDYIIIKKKIFNMMNSKNQLKYTAFMRLSFSEFTSLMTLFPLSEIVEYLSNDTGLKINYGSVWSAYKATEIRIKKNSSAVSHEPRRISNESPNHAQIDSDTEESLNSYKDQSYDWLYTKKYAEISKYAQIVKIIKNNNLTEKDIELAKPNILNPLQMIKTITEYAHKKKLDESSRRIFSLGT